VSERIALAVAGSFAVQSWSPRELMRTRSALRHSSTR
jgi:hypothetical protein